MTWCKEHINLTWVSFTLLQFVGIAFDSVVPFVVLRALWIVATFWALHQKGRNWLWFLIPVSVLFLSNQRSGETGWIRLSDVHSNGSTDEHLPSANKKYLQEVMSCPTCVFAGELSSELPWCVAPNVPAIKGVICNTWQRKAESGK